jgi:CTP synthase
MKYIVVTGGVVSGLGKGVTISSMGRLLQACGLTVTSIKIDPYLNVDAGTMSPFEHGEVFVLQDGGESDLDLGNYERFLDIELTSDHNITTGKIYRHVILKERRGDYLGKTVQVVPHISNEIQDWIERVAKIPVNKEGALADVCLIEVGGTVGDIESAIFLEALRQFQFRVGVDNFLLCFVSLVPIISEEQKTKPTQHGVKDLRSLGLSPSIIFCRCSQVLNDATKQKISNFCHVPPNCVLSVHDVHNVYHVPSLLESQGLHKLIAQALKLQTMGDADLVSWKKMAHALDTFEKTTTIALIGKYTGLQDSYLSVIKALKHASVACETKLDLQWVEATHLERHDESGKDISDSEQYIEAWNKVKQADGVIVPGGFGNRYV